MEILAPQLPVCILLAGCLCKELTSSDHKAPHSHNYLQIQNFPDECQLEVGRPSQRRHNLIVCSKQAAATSYQRIRKLAKYFLTLVPVPPQIYIISFLDFILSEAI